MSQQFRHDLRSEFERHQAGLGDVAEARRRLMQNALTVPVRDSRRLQWAAAIAAVLIATIVIVTFALVRGVGNSQVAPGARSPQTSVTPTPLGNEISVGDATPLILYYDPGNFNQVDGVTWDGTQSGRLGLGGASGVVANPAGTIYATGSEYRNRTGKLIAHMDPGGKYFRGTWADDGVHYCRIVPFNVIGAAGTPAALELTTPGGIPQKVASVGKLYEDAATYVAACSVQADRAVVVQLGGVWQYWVVQLSTGRVLWTRNFGFNTSTRQYELTVASRDGQYIAEVHNAGTPAQPSFESTIYGPNGMVEGHVHGAVQAFSWDGSLAVVGAKERQLSVVRWRDSTVIWSAPQGVWYGGWARPEPGGHRIAVGVFNPAGHVSVSGPQPLDVYVVSADGHAVAWDQIYPI